jgi:hypothetical protein
MLSLDEINVLGEGFFHRCGKHGVSILVTLAGSNEDLVAAEINVLDPQHQAFHDSETCSVEQHGREPIQAVKAGKNRLDFLSRQNGRKPLRPVGPDNAVDVTNVFTENVPVEEQNCAQGLVLRRGAYMGVARHAGEKGGDFFLAHLCEMTLVVEEDKPFNPVDISFLGSWTIVPHSDRVADLIEQLRLLRGRGADWDHSRRSAFVSAVGLDYSFYMGIAHKRFSDIAIRNLLQPIL